MIFLATDKGWGPIDQEQIDELDHNIFPCGKCADTESQVYHNLLGRHCHKKASDMERLFDFQINL